MPEFCNRWVLAELVHYEPEQQGIGGILQFLVRFASIVVRISCCDIGW